MFESEDHWLSQKHSARLLVDGGGDYVRVNCQLLLIVAYPLHFHFYCGVLRGQKSSQVFVENEHHLDLSCTRGEKKDEGVAN